MGESVLSELSKQKGLAAWFLILWGASFFFSAIWGFLDVSNGGYSAGYLIIEVLWDLTHLGIAAVLIMLGLKLREKM